MKVDSNFWLHISLPISFEIDRGGSSALKPFFDRLQQRILTTGATITAIFLIPGHTAGAITTRTRSAFRLSRTTSSSTEWRRSAPVAGCL